MGGGYTACGPVTATSATDVSVAAFLVALNKIELLLEEELLEKRQELGDHCGQAVLAISAATSKNLDQLLARTWKELGI